MRRSLGLLVGLAVTAVAVLQLSPVQAAAPPGGVYISEFMASNAAGGLADEDGDLADWIEIRNGGGTTVDLAGWTISDKAAQPRQWTFPSRQLSAGATLVLFAGKDRAPATGNLHTSFGLSAGGEYLGLFRPDGTVASQFSPAFPAQTPGVSYGIDSSGEQRFFTTPTPGASNDVGDAPAAPVSSSLPRGFYSGPQIATLTTTSAGATIRYTTDGSAPTASSSAYSAPLPITTTTTLRAAAFPVGGTPSPVATYTYLFVADVVHQGAGIAGFPNGRLKWVGGPNTPANQVPEDTAMDADVVSNPAYASQMEAALTAIPSVSLSLPTTSLFGAAGFYDQDDLDQPLSVEVLYPQNPEANEQVDGSAESQSWDRLKRSIRLKFGGSGWTSELLRGAPQHGASATDTFSTLVLRAGNNRAWSRIWNPDATDFTLDQLVRDTQVAMSGFGSHGNFVHLYLNGVYWGLYNPSERPDDDFGATYFGGDDGDWFYYKGDNQGPTTRGDATRWNHLTETLLDRDLSDQANYDEVGDYLDLAAFADYLIMQWWFGVTDWPGNNFYAVNRADSSPLGPTPIRFVAWDAEWSMDRKQGSAAPGAWVAPDFLPEATSTEVIPSIWRALRRSPQFMELFAERVDVQLAPGGALNDAAVTARYEALNATVETAVIAESARWGDSLESLGHPLRTRDGDWRREVAAIKALIDGNSARFLNALRAAGYYEAPLPSAADTLRISLAPTRTGSGVLTGATVAADTPLYVFLEPAVGDAPSKVEFWVDTAVSARPLRTESVAPFDLGGGGVDVADPIRLASGTHTVTARATLAGGATRQSSATFVVVPAGTPTTTAPTTTAPTTSAPTTTTTTAPQPASDSLRVSAVQTRGGAVALQGSTFVAGSKAAIFLDTATTYVRVAFYLDNPAAIGSPIRVEALAPWDVGGGSQTIAALYSLPTSIGSHTLTAVGLKADNTTVKTTATFEVVGTPTTPSTTPSTTTTSPSSTVPTTVPTSPSTTVPTSPTDALLVSSSSRRLAPVPLDGARLTASTSVAIHLASPNAYTSVAFYLGVGTAQGARVRSESIAPWDFAGGGLDTANLFRLTLDPGTYTVTAVGTAVGGRTVTTKATFTIV